MKKLKESTGIQIIISFFIILSILVLVLWYTSLRVPIFEQNGNLTNSATVTIEIAIGIFIAISILITERSWQKTITALIARSETILINQEKDRERRITYAISRLKTELEVMENWTSVVNGYIDTYTKERSKSTDIEKVLPGLVMWLKEMDQVRTENVHALENIFEFSKEVFNSDDIDDIERLIICGKDVHIPYQRKGKLFSGYDINEIISEIQETIQRLQEKIKSMSS